MGEKCPKTPKNPLFMPHNICLSGPAHGMVTKTIHKTLPGNGGNGILGVIGVYRLGVGGGLGSLRVIGSNGGGLGNRVV